MDNRFDLLADFADNTIGINVLRGFIEQAIPNRDITNMNLIGWDKPNPQENDALVKNNLVLDVNGRTIAFHLHDIAELLALSVGEVWDRNEDSFVTF